MIISFQSILIMIISFQSVLIMIILYRGRALGVVGLAALKRHWVTTVEVIDFMMMMITMIMVRLARMMMVMFMVMMVTMMMVQVPCNDKAYSWVLEWISREAAKSSLHVSVRSN